MSVEFQYSARPTLEAAVQELLPETGSIEVQRDTPGRRHDWHTHQTDETLLIIDGELSFESELGLKVCRPGDRILLPQGVRHASTAGVDGCIYLIALRRVSQRS
ncbi:quercetin dioxygenase-like cupin family protein [Bradyrhizobium sp. AZCC 1610]|uniref:cupin domain-containing protein n=1 Tax=Bradyrhizobium sp. AZCC 1610 TaxID=3117020 RepID=UPI002FF09A64